MAEDQSFRELLAFVDAALAPDADADAADVQRRLQNAMPDFLNLLHQKVITPLRTTAAAVLQTVIVSDDVTAPALTLHLTAILLQLSQLCMSRLDVDELRQAPNAAARQQVASRSPQLPPPRGRIHLDDEPDVREVRMLQKQQ